MTMILPLEIENRLAPYRGRIVALAHSPVCNCAQVSRLLCVPLCCIAKGVLWEGVRDGSRVFAFTVVPADKMVSLPRAQACLGSATLILAREPQRVTGYAAGSLPPFGLPTRVAMLMDNQLAQQKRVFFGSGIPTVSLISAGEVLAALSGARLIRLVE